MSRSKRNRQNWSKTKRDSQLSTWCQKFQNIFTEL